MKQIFFFMFSLLYSIFSMAHLQQGFSTSFHSGWLHPLTGLDHLIAMVIVGILTTRYKEKSAFLLPSIFILSLSLASVIAPLMEPIIGLVEPFIAISLIAFGYLLYRKQKFSFAMAGVLTGFFAFFHGYAHGLELPPGGSSLNYVIGFILTTGFLHFSGAFLARKIEIRSLMGAFSILMGLILLLSQGLLV